jgi:hypothetical protein
LIPIKQPVIGVWSGSPTRVRQTDGSGLSSIAGEVGDGSIELNYRLDVLNGFTITVFASVGICNNCFVGTRAQTSNGSTSLPSHDHPVFLPFNLVRGYTTGRSDANKSILIAAILIAMA